MGAGTSTANFTNTVFDDNAATPIQNGSAPFFATFNPQQSLATAFAGAERPGDLDAGHPERVDDRRHRHAQQLVADASRSRCRPPGLGEPGSDNASGQLPHLHAEPDRRAVEPGLDGGRPGVDRRRLRQPGRDSAAASGRVTGLAIDPSDPSGNTVYVAGASGGIWKTTNFLTTSPAGPTCIPLTDFGPTFGVNIGGIAVFARNHDPNQSIIIAATGEGDTGTPGVGFLISHDGGATWNLYDSTDQRRFQRQPAADQLRRTRPRRSSARRRSRSSSIPSSRPPAR